jgi:tetratricopeptide (TPR) repeat protein
VSKRRVVVCLTAWAASLTPVAGQSWRAESAGAPARQPVWELPEWGEETPQPRTLREEYGVVSTVELRNPLRGAALRTIQRAARDLREGRRGRALEDLRGALSDPGARAHALCLLGTEHLKMGLVKEAVAELEEAVRLLPGSAAAHNNLGYALRLSGDRARAVEEVRRALQLDPRSPAIRFGMGGLLLELGRTQEAIFHLRLAGDDLPSARRLLAEHAQAVAAPE